MKKTLFVLSFFALAFPAFGAPTMIKALSDANSSLPAYQWKVTQGDLGNYSTGEQFRSFCLEAREYFNIGNSYYAVLNTEALMGGNNLSDPLDPRTAYLYTQYMSGEYGYALNTEKALQEAIHVIEGERASTSTALAGAFVVEANNCGWTSIGNVRVVNLWTNYNPTTGVYSGFAQDQLVLVPAPGALILAAVGVTVVGLVRRRQIA